MTWASGDDLALTAGIGCSAWIAVYIHADVLKVLHGRAIPAAIGLKATSPSRKVVTFTGDGDCLAIGGNHLLHAARRNIDMTVVMVNNQIYAMTGGQVAPSTKVGSKTQTTPYGNVEKPLDGCKVAIAAGATMVSRWSTAHPQAAHPDLQEGAEPQGLFLYRDHVPVPGADREVPAGLRFPPVQSSVAEGPLREGSKILPNGERSRRRGRSPWGISSRSRKPEFMEEVQRMNQRVKEAQAKGGDR